MTCIPRKAMAEAVVGRRGEQAVALIASHLQTTADLVLASTLFRSSADTATAAADARA